MFSFIYRFFCVLTNAAFFKNTFVKLTQISKGLPYCRLTFLERLFWSIFPNVKPISYNIVNDTTVKLLDFRKKYFSSLSYKISSYYSFNYSISLKTFNQFINFFSIRSANFFNVQKIFFTKNNYFAVYLLFFFLKRNFYRYFSVLFFTESDNSNLIKINYIFFRYFYRADIEKIKLDLFNLWKSSDWYSYNFDSKNLCVEKNIGDYKNIWFDFFKEEWLEKRDYYVSYYTNIFPILVSRGMALVTKAGYTYIDYLVLCYENFHKIILNNEFRLKLKSILPSRFNERSTNKFIDLLKTDNYSFFYLRKNKIFNKGRYSRNRQTYRTGFYWSLWVNIFAIYGLHFAFYRFTFNFGYLWVPFIVFFGAFLFSRILKYNFHNYNYIVSEFMKLYTWLSLLFASFPQVLIRSFYFLIKLFGFDYGYISSSKLKLNGYINNSGDLIDDKLFAFNNFVFVQTSIFDSIFDYFGSFFLNLDLKNNSDQKDILTFIFYNNAK